MVVKKILALAGALMCLTLAISSGAGAKSSRPTIRIEGVKKTLLQTTAVSTGGATVSKAGHTCPGSSAAGALNRATRGRWSGKWYSGLGFEVFTVLGENDQFTSTKSYWELFVNNVAASVGMCSVTLKPGQQLLFAAVPATGTEYPLGLTVLSKPVAGKPFGVKVVFYDARGKAKPLAGATVTGGGISAEPIPHDRISARTNSHGVATLTEPHRGLIDLGASKNGYIRAATVVRDVA